MNESYLSRGKRKDNGEWVEGFYSCDIWDGETEYILYDEQEYEVIPGTVGQCTGLKDKNGKLIFEGDIVRAYKHDETQYTQAITLRDDCFWFGSWNWIEFLNVFRNLEVIGNMHDNPELLEAMANDR